MKSIIDYTSFWYIF